MIAVAVQRTLNQLFDPRFRAVLLKSLALSAAALVMTGFALWGLWPRDWTTGFAVIDGLGFTLVMLAATYVIFPALSTIFIGMQIDDIIDAVEEHYYPAHKGPIRVPVSDAIFSGLSLLGAAVMLNLLALIPYLILLVISSGIGTLILAVILNGYLIGREYFEAVAYRQAPRKAANMLRKKRRGDWMPGGMVVAALFMVPGINIIAPIAGIAVMTHIFHQIRQQQAVAA